MRISRLTGPVLAFAVASAIPIVGFPQSATPPAASEKHYGVRVEMGFLEKNTFDSSKNRYFLKVRPTLVCRDRNDKKSEPDEVLSRSRAAGMSKDAVFIDPSKRRGEVVYTETDISGFLRKMGVNGKDFEKDCISGGNTYLGKALRVYVKDDGPEGNGTDITYLHDSFYFALKSFRHYKGKPFAIVDERTGVRFLLDPYETSNSSASPQRAKPQSGKVPRK